jgi:hypothetical protein
MARHERCAGRWISAIWRGPLATDGTGELPLAPAPRRARPTRVRRVRRVADVAVHDVAAERVSTFPVLLYFAEQFSK